METQQHLPSNSESNMCRVDCPTHLAHVNQEVTGSLLPPASVKQRKVGKNATADSNDNAHPFKWQQLTLRDLIDLPQPAHFVAVVGILYLAFVFFPKESHNQHQISNDVQHSFTTLVYIGTFAAHFGAQMWMTFISGIVLFFTIPRKLFAQVQQILFPLYFFLNSIMALATVITFLQQHPSDTRTTQLQTQIGCLSLCFFIELFTRIYVVPNLLGALQLRMELEETADMGHEIGRHDFGVLKNCRHYLQLHKKFRRFHGLCAVCNLTALGLNVIHLYFIATTMNI